MAGVGVCPHFVSGWFSQPVDRAFPMGLGLCDVQQGSAPDHAQLSIGNETAEVSHLAR